MFGSFLNIVGRVLNARFFDCEDAINNITHDHTLFIQAHVLEIANMHAFLISRMFDLHVLACMYIELSIVEYESSSIL